jgi:hypothetical protein
MALVLALANHKSATAQTTLQADQAEVIERALRLGLQDLDMLLQEE